MFHKLQLKFVERQQEKNRVGEGVDEGPQHRQHFRVFWKSFSVAVATELFSLGRVNELNVSGVEGNLVCCEENEGRSGVKWTGAGPRRV
jgi:hypothetical protein